MGAALGAGISLGQAGRSGCHAGSVCLDEPGAASGEQCMRVLGLAVGTATLITIQVLAIQVLAMQTVVAQAMVPDARVEKSLQQLDPEDRLEQLCDYTAMTHIRKDAGHYRPDRAVANAMTDAHISQDLSLI